MFGRFQALWWTFSTISFFIWMESAFGHDHDHQDFNSKMVQNAEHIKEHYPDMPDIVNEETGQEELGFHFFKQHDYDNNSMLDGLEVYKAISHSHYSHPKAEEYMEEMVKTVRAEHPDKSPEEIIAHQRETHEERLAEMIDEILTDFDFDKDGYLTYTEYTLGIMKRGAQDDTEDREK